MLDEKRIRQMTKLAFYEEKEGKEAQKISRYFRSDYIGKELLKNFFAATAGYLLVLAVLALDHITWFLDAIDSVDLAFLGGSLIVSYLIFLLLYSILTYVLASVRYARAQKSVKEYARELGVLLKLYEKKNPAENKEKHGRKKT